MQTKKQKLISSLKLAINALKNKTIHYDWKEQASCNCGVVAQAILGKDVNEIEKLFSKVRDKIREIHNKQVIEGNNTTQKADTTWRNGVKHLCPISGEPMAVVYKLLFEAGLSKEDIVHLEYMDNQAILAKSGIQTQIDKVETIKTVIGTKTNPHPNKIKAFFGATVKDELIKETSVNKKVTDKAYFTKESNLILYLTAWVKILEGGVKYHNGDDISSCSVAELQTELILAEADERYEDAIILRDKINLM